MSEPHMSQYAVSYTTYGNHGCRCDGCREDMNRYARKHRAEASPATRRKMNAYADARYRRRNAESVAAAVNMGKPWTSEDLAIACDRSMSVMQSAKVLGRSMDSVKHMRRRTAR